MTRAYKFTILVTAILGSLLLVDAVAQQAAQPPSPHVLALSERIGIEVNNNIACRTEVAELRARIAELEAKAKKE